MTVESLRRHRSARPRTVPAGDLRVQGAEALCPERSVPVEPLVELGQRFGPEAVHPPLRVGAHVHEARLPQDAQVARHTGSGDGQDGGELAGGGRSVGEHLQEAPSPTVGHGVECGIHDRMCNTSCT